MIYLYSSNRLEYLANQLADTLNSKNNSLDKKNSDAEPFSPDIVVVQSQGMERWLKLQIAQHNTICANLFCPFPKAFIMQCLEKTTGVPENNLFSRQALIWRIYGFLRSSDELPQPEFDILHTYLQDGQSDLKCYQLSEKLAGLYDQYCTFRPASIMAWSGYEREQIPFPDPIFKSMDHFRNHSETHTENHSETHTKNHAETHTKNHAETHTGNHAKIHIENHAGNHEIWQKLLWHKLYESASGGTLLNSVAKFLFSDISRWKGVLPREIHLFGMSSIPLQFMLFFEKLAQITDVHIYYLSPCREFWEDCVKEKTRLILDLKSGEEHYWEVGNPLLSSMGISARDFSRIITALEGTIDFACFQPSLRGDEQNQLEAAPFPEEMQREIQAGQLLHRIQNDVLFLRDSSRREKSPPTSDTPLTPDIFSSSITPLTADSSISVHICHSRMREVEVLYDQLLNMMNEDLTLKPRDFLIMTPDIALYAPYIKAVFDNPETSDMKIPYSIADRMPAQDNPVARAFLLLLSLDQTRFTAVDIMEILRVNAVYTRFGLDEKALELIYRWIGESGIRWGIDKNYKRDIGLPERHENSWQFGFDRILMGYAVAQDQGILHNILPLDIEGSDTEIAGRFMGFFDHLLTFTRGLYTLSTQTNQPSDMEAWENIFTQGLDIFFEENSENEDDLREVWLAVNQLFENIRKSGYNGSLGLDALLCDFRAFLQDDSGGRGFLHGGITFCRFRPMRSIPARVICLTGMDDGAFPRQGSKPGFDLMAAAPLPGDNTSRVEERYLFLEALLSAQDRLYISYVGRSIKDNTPMPPSVLVSELMDYIGEQSNELIVEHPLQAFSPRYFDGFDPNIFSFSMSRCKGAEAMVKVQKKKKSLKEQKEKKSLKVQEEKKSLKEQKEKKSLKEQEEKKILKEQKGKKNLEEQEVCETQSRKPTETKGKKGDQEDVQLHNLLRFFANPARYYMKDLLNINLLHDDFVQPETDEPFEWETRDFFRNTALLEQMLEKQSIFNARSVYGHYNAAGAMPAGLMEQKVFEEHFQELSDFACSVMAQQSGKQVDPQAFYLDLGSEIHLTGNVAGYYSDFGLMVYRFAGTRQKIYFQTWLEGLALKATGEIPCENALMIYKHPGKPEPAIESLVLPSEEQCREVLMEICRIYRSGMEMPLPFFPESSFACAEAVHKCKPDNEPYEKAISAARKAWLPSYVYRGECGDPYFSAAFGEDWFSDASSQELKFFFDIARKIYMPVLQAVI